MKKSPDVNVREVTVTRRIALEDKVCPQCHKAFKGMRIQKYCSKRCSNLAAYWRHPEAYRQSRMKHYHKQKAQPVRQRKKKPEPS